MRPGRGGRGRVYKVKHDYPDDWKPRSAHVKKRDGGRCLLCGSTIDTEVHHMISKTKGSGANRKILLITLCFKCHAKQPGHEHLKKSKKYKN